MLSRYDESLLLSSCSVPVPPRLRVTRKSGLKWTRLMPLPPTMSSAYVLSIVEILSQRISLIRVEVEKWETNKNIQRRLNNTNVAHYIAKDL